MPCLRVMWRGNFGVIGVAALIMFDSFVGKLLCPPEEETLYPVRQALWHPMPQPSPPQQWRSRV